MLKKSIYNFSTTISVDGKEHSMVFNTKTRKLLDLTGFSLDSLSAQDKIKLIKNGFLVDGSLDEVQQSKYLRVSQLFQKKLLSLTIIPTADCNFRCVYCYQVSQKSYMQDTVAEGIIQFLKRHVKYYECLSITWFGGEPLLSKPKVLYLLEQAKKICKENKTAFVSYMTTNGYELDTEFFTQALSFGLRYYQITIDGLSKEHNAQRPHICNLDSYEKIIHNLIMISNTVDKRFEIGIRVNVTSTNIGRMHEFIKSMADLFRNDKRFVLIWQWARDWGGSRLDRNILVQNTVCTELIDTSERYGMRCFEAVSCHSGTDFCEACYKNGYVINFDGGVYKCAMKTFNVDDSDLNCIGRLNPNGTMTIDETKEAKWLLPSIRESCYKCVFFPLCMGNACPLTLASTGKQTCIVYKDLIPTQLKTLFLSGNYITIGRYKNE